MKFPHANAKPPSGQVFWTAALAPNQQHARFLSYWNGGATTLGWIFANAGTFVFTAQIWIAAAAVNNPDYVPATYHVFLVTAANALLGVIINTKLFNWYPHLTKFGVVFINLGTVFVLVALLVRTSPKASAATVFLDVVNETGWGSNGLVFMLCFLPGCVAVACFDTAAHMAEEMDEPARQVPLVMVGTAVLCIVTAIPMILVYLFCASQPENLLTPIGGQPLFQLFHDGFRSPSLLTAALVLYCIVYALAPPATIATASRLIWSFAKHGGLPFPRWFGYVEPKSQIPVNGVYVTAGVATLISLLLFGPSTILNGVFGAGGVCFFFSYGMPIWFNVATWGRQLPKDRYFNLGRLSMPISILAICWQLITVVFLSFPMYRPVTTTNMNWGSVCAIIGLTLSGFNWFAYARKHYHTPKPLYVEALHAHTTNVTDADMHPKAI